MLKVMTAYTLEIDDEEIAVEELLSQLDLDELKKNSIGIMSCHYECLNSGVYEAVYEALSFNIVGATSSSQGVPGQNSPLMIALTVITSDDVEFATMVTPNIVENVSEVIEQTYLATHQNSGRKEAPGLILAFAPFLLSNCGDDYVNALSRVSGDVPCFGTLSVDDTLDFANCYVFADGKAYKEELVAVLLYGNIEPKFFIANISPNNTINKTALITKSHKHLLMEINDRPIIEYFEDLGLAKAVGSQYAMTSLPLLLDYNDGTPLVAKQFIKMNDDGSGICASEMPVGSTIYMAVADKQDVIDSTIATVEDIRANMKDASLMLAYTCVGRYMVLGADSKMAVDIFDERIGDELPFLFACSGGEMCPTQIEGKVATNRFHNNSLVVCLI